MREGGEWVCVSLLLSQGKTNYSFIRHTYIKCDIKKGNQIYCSRDCLNGEFQLFTYFNFKLWNLRKILLDFGRFKSFLIPLRETVTDRNRSLFPLTETGINLIATLIQLSLKTKSYISSSIAFWLIVIDHEFYEIIFLELFSSLCFAHKYKNISFSISNQRQRPWK